MIIRLLKVVLLGGSVIAAPLYGASMDITAGFAPDFSNPSNNEFKNTTPLGGFCKDWSSYCKQQGVDFSISLPLTANRSYAIPADNAPRDGVYFKLPKSSQVTVVNENNETALLTFDIEVFSGTYGRSYNSNEKGWVRGAWLYAPTGCGSTGLAAAPTNGAWYSFAWRYTGTPCAKISRLNRDGQDVHSIWDQSIAYTLKTPAPLSMGSGIYKGQLRWLVGPGGDIDYGDNFIPNASELIINFTLTVNHELKVTPLTGATDVTLYPCYRGTHCTKDEAEKNWERWMVTNVTPQKMSGRSEFNLSSSGSFTVYMQCGSGAALDANRCPMTSGKSGTSVPVKATITLPENIADSAGQRVTDSPLFTEKNNARNRFQTHTFGTDKKGWVDFVIEQKDVKEMLKTRPDSWSGTVTLLFDPNLY
ncbi:hypothetical protein [Serratia inhibens]